VIALTLQGGNIKQTTIDTVTPQGLTNGDSRNQLLLELFQWVILEITGDNYIDEL